MRKSLIVLIAVILASQALMAGDGLVRLSKSQVERQIGDLVYNDTRASMNIWLERYAYTQGQSTVLRATVNPNDDLFPFTMFLYRKNLETGDKAYYGQGVAASATAVDINGLSADDGYGVMQLPSMQKQVLIGPGGMIVNGDVSAPAQGQYDWVLEVRDYTGNRVVRTAHAKFSVVNQFVEVGGTDITQNTTWTNDNAYTLNDSVFVLSPATLTIEPGTVILGQGQTALLAIARGAKIMSMGTRARPVVMSCNLEIGQRLSGCWGGLVINGNAPINTPGGEEQSEGIEDPAKGAFGGDDPNDDSGALYYTRVEFGGVQFTAENELNGIAFQAVGSGTEVDYIQTHVGADDGSEFFGGTVNIKHVVSSAMGDDSIDWTLGWTGKAQFLIAQHNPDDADQGFECDNNDDNNDLLPRSMPTIFNATMLGVNDAEATESDIGMLVREGTAGHFNNVLVMGYGEDGLRIVNEATIEQGANGNLTVSGAIFWRNNLRESPGTTFADNFPDADSQTFMNAQQKIFVVNPQLRRPFDRSDPDFRPAIAANGGSPALAPGWSVPPPDDGFFDTKADYIGAVGPHDDWYGEWTIFVDEVDLAP